MSGHPYWSQAKQYQQQPGKAQQPVRQQTQQPRRGVRDDFGNEWMGKDVDVEVARGTNVVVLRGRVVDVAKYWIKMLVDGGVIYVNKAAVVTIKPKQ
ncbi:MAG: hypothetical protein L7H00_05295 [Vulcanisaeta sp.]|nr:hypothetical protein [Vulcanisaeta sp.]MCG2892933.1 hypothetical protein [Vulcanisaeta sp.]